MLILFVIMTGRVRAMLRVGGSSTIKLSSPENNVRQRRMITCYDKTIDTSI